MGTNFPKNPYASPVSSKASNEEALVPAKRNRLLWFVAFSLSALPLINYFYVLLFWIVACFLLGEWVRPGTHDPTEFLSGVPYALHVALMLSSFGVLPFVFVIGYKSGKFWQLLALYITSLSISLLLFRLDLMEVSTWIAD